MRRLLFLLLLLPATARADEPTKDDLKRFENQLTAAHAKVGPSLACIVVSRSDKYPRPATASEPWQLGRFDRDAFLKEDPKRVPLALQLDLSDPESIPDHGFAGGAVVDAAGYVLTNYHGGTRASRTIHSAESDHS